MASARGVSSSSRPRPRSSTRSVSGRNPERRARAAEQRVVEPTRTLRFVASTVESDGSAEQAATKGPLRLEWILEYDGNVHAHRLRSATSERRPGQVRLDATGRLVAESATGRGRRVAQLVLRIPHSVAAAVESGDFSAFRLEVLDDGAWRDATLVDRGAPLADQHARTYDAQATGHSAIRIVS